MVFINLINYIVTIIKNNKHNSDGELLLTMIELYYCFRADCIIVVHYYVSVA